MQYIIFSRNTPVPGHTCGWRILGQVLAAVVGLGVVLFGSSSANAAPAPHLARSLVVAKPTAPFRPTATRPQYWSVSHAGAAAAWGWWYYGDDERLYVSGTIADTKADGLSAVARLVFWGNHAGQRREEDPSVSGNGHRKTFNYNSRYSRLEVQACTHGYSWYWSCSRPQWVA